MSNELKKLFEENPKAKEEFDTIIDVLSAGATGEIERLLRYIEELEEMIEEGADRATLLQRIDEHNGWTMWMHADGYLSGDETWWESVLQDEGKCSREGEIRKLQQVSGVHQRKQEKLQHMRRVWCASSLEPLSLTLVFVSLLDLL